MSDSNELKPAVTNGTPVPDLIEQYRVRRDAWIAQADELARLRDEVRGSAEREAMEIVTSARRDVRQIVMEARRELLVLSAQVQAALGDAATRPNPALLNRGSRDGEGDDVGAATFSDAIFAPEEVVKGMLDQARADMDALVEDARTVPFQALAEPARTIPAPEPPPVREPLLPAESRTSAASLVAAPEADTSATSRGLLSSPYPSDAVPVPSDRRAKLFVGLFGAAGVAVLVGTIWWIRSDNEPRAPETTQTAAPATSSTASVGTPAAAPVSGPASTADTPVGSSALSLLVEAKRSSWLRTTVDGQADGGRMLAQGETVRLNAKQSVSLRVGDAGAVYVSVNDGQPAPLGRDGQVITRQFVVESAARSTAPPAPPQPDAQQPPQAAPIQKAVPLSSPIASGPPVTQAPVPSPVPLVQPVAATPSSPPLEAGPPSPAPPPPPRETVPPPVVARPELPAPTPATPTSAVTLAARQWLDAYHRQDRAAMSALSTEGLQLTDERRNEERFPANVEVSRTLDRINVQIAADTAVLTGVMTERSADNSIPPRVSPISQVWELRGNQWRVRQVRLVSEARLNQIFR
jgi:hypothetical protein